MGVVEHSLNFVSPQKAIGQSIAGRKVAFDGADFYETPSWATEKLLEMEAFPGIVREPCSGRRAICKVLENAGMKVISSDLRVGPKIHGAGGVSIFEIPKNSCNHIITNPPYGIASDVVKASLEISRGKVAMLLKLSFLESAKRHAFFKSTPLKTVYVFSNRVDVMGLLIMSFCRCLCLQRLRYHPRLMPVRGTTVLRIRSWKS